MMELHDKQSSLKAGHTANLLYVSADSGTLRRNDKQHLVAQHVPNIMYQSADGSNDGGSNSRGSTAPDYFNGGGGGGDGSYNVGDVHGGPTTLSLYTIPMEEDVHVHVTATAAAAD